MLATMLIVFREVIEAALVISIVLAAAKGIRYRNRWVALGIGVGIVGAILVAVFANVIAAAGAGMGQELLNATILFSAVIMLGWNNVWMSRHGRQLAKDIGDAGKAVRSGVKPIYMLAGIVGLAVLREGAEVVLFLYGILAAGGTGGGGMLEGGILGLVGGIAFGATLYFGLLRIPMRHLFKVTSGMITLLAAGMAAQGAYFLVQAAWLPPLGQSLWDSSAILSEGSVLGRILHTLVGYVARPSGMQLIFYVATVLVIVGLTRAKSPRRAVEAAAKATVKVLATLGIVGISVGATLVADAGQARAGTKVFSPKIVKGEAELEVRGNADFDRRANRDGNQKYKVELGYAPTDFWFVELETEIKKRPNTARSLEAAAIENIFRLLPEGKYWLDLGFFAEYEFTQPDKTPDEFQFGPILQKQFGKMVVTVNPFFIRQVGNHPANGVTFKYGIQTKYRLMPEFELGVEAFGEPGIVGAFGPLRSQVHQIGPVAFGKFRLGAGKAIKYQIGVLFGLTRNSPDATVKWILEYELQLL